MADLIKQLAGVLRAQDAVTLRSGGFIRLRLLVGLVAGTMFCGSLGCSTLKGLQQAYKHNDCIDDLMLAHRNRAWAAKAWIREKKRHCNQRHIADFRAGFEKGYQDIAEGSDGCTPAIAPQEYWGWMYQSPDGQAKIAAWFSGYPLGAQAAEQDGVGNLSQVHANFKVPEQVAAPVPGVMPGGMDPAMPAGMQQIGSASIEPNPQALAEGMPLNAVPSEVVLQEEISIFEQPIQVETDAEGRPVKMRPAFGVPQRLPEATRSMSPPSPSGGGLVPGLDPKAQFQPSKEEPNARPVPLPQVSSGRPAAGNDLPTSVKSIEDFENFQVPEPRL